MDNLLAQIGTITPPSTIPTVGPTENPSLFVAGFIRAGITLLITVSFIVAFIWIIFAGFRYITSGGDPKTTGQAWSSIYWGLIGMMIVVGSFAIMLMIEAFFGIDIINQPFQLPSGN